jgi:hypothetical protein
MHRLTTSCLRLGVLAAISCGAPAELDESTFPGPNEVGYADDDGTGTTGTPLGGGGAGGAGGSPAVGSGGSSTAPPANGASGAAPSSGGGGTPVDASGSAQAGAAGGGSAPVAGGAAGGCPDDITVLFNRPLTDGGCSGQGCHVPQGVPPDLVSPNVEARLIDVVSTCNGRPYIGSADSFLADKVGEDQPECGSPMPFLQSDLLKAADRQCILDWIDEVTGG